MFKRWSENRRTLCEVCCCPDFGVVRHFPFQKPKSPFSIGTRQLCRVPQRRQEEGTFPSACVSLLYWKSTWSSPGVVGDTSITGPSRGAIQFLEYM